jgi:cytoskeletal protein CcmA (bactofilin family)
MWRKTDDSKLKSASDDTLSSPPPAQQPVASTAQHSPRASDSVGQGIHIKGEITGQGDFFLDGGFEGKIHLPDGIFTVGPNARVNAEIEAREIIVRGEVIGTLKARERVHIWSTGKLTGNMETRGIVIEDGAVLHSKVATPQAATPQVAAPAATEREAASPEKEQQKDQPVQGSRSEAPARGKRAAAAGSPTPSNPQEP